MKIVDIHDEPQCVFYFKNSLEPFIVATADDGSGDYLFTDLHSFVTYQLTSLAVVGYDFYKLEEDDDFLGVRVEDENWEY